MQKQFTTNLTTAYIEMGLVPDKWHNKEMRNRRRILRQWQKYWRNINIDTDTELSHYVCPRLAYM